MSEVSAFAVHLAMKAKMERAKNKKRSSDVMEKVVRGGKKRGSRDLGGKIANGTKVATKRKRKSLSKKNAVRSKKRLRKSESSDSEKASDFDADGASAAMTSSPQDQEILNGDDVPLVEEFMEEMVEDSTDGLDETPFGSEALVTGENFLSTVLKSNSEMLRDVRKKEGKKSPSHGHETTKKKAARLEKMLKVTQSPVHGTEKGKKKKNIKQKSVVADREGDGDSVARGKEHLEFILSPVDVNTFMKENWEKSPLHVKRGQSQEYYSKLFSTKVLDSILREQCVIYGKNLDVTSYEGARATHNPIGRAYPPVVWDYYNNGCSLRMLNPQTFHEPVWEACATLQEFFGSMVGANIYLTPPGTQGFAPHYDDVEVFILQLEGKKRWRLYEPRSRLEKLARFSSNNLTQEEIGDPCLDIILESGDLLYFPRGTIHQATCLSDTHSLHITISCHQLNSFGDLLQKIVPAALETALTEAEEFRQGLPVDYLSFMGVSNCDKKTPARNTFLGVVQNLMSRLFEFASVDAACDQMGKRFVHDALPPYLSQAEKRRTVQADGERWNAKKMRVCNRVEIDPDTEIRLLRQHCVRLVVEADTVFLYYSVENSRQYHEVDEQYLEIDCGLAPAVEALIEAYPKYIKAEDLLVDGLDLKMQLVQDLWERKIIMTRQPLEAHYDD